ncbi:MAG: TIGR01777 family protein [Deltaproteobacteria bacterium RBG_13_65_10]|nr:MAG: TIGR01777 family protein [Deltaproteobacteria bacterium RBG_13_65_10]
MRILVTGAGGLVGSALVPCLRTHGHGVTRLVRSRRPRGDEVRWDPIGGTIDPASLEGFDAVIHLAGESIASGRWTPEVKARIRDSRVRGTRLLCETLARLDRPPHVLLSASAIGYYGDRGDEVLREESTAGSGFLSEVCRAWEAATEAAARKGIRVAHLRFGVVLSPAGGALAKMLPPFRLGAGGRLGNGRQFMSWITINDAINAIVHVLKTDALIGPVNVVAPAPERNADFTRALGRALGRPTPLPVPALALRLLLGEMAGALLLSSARVEPARLLSTGFAFRTPYLRDALTHLLGC